MQKIKNIIARRSNQPQTSNLKSNRFSYKVLIFFAVLMVTIGGYFVYQSFAADISSLPSGNDDLVLEYEFSGPKVVTAVPIYDFVPIRVYGNGLAICGNDSPKDSTKTFPYYKKQLKPAELKALVAKLTATGITKYQIPANAVRISHNEDSIKLNLKDGLYELPFNNIGNKPATFAAAEQVIKDFCNTLTEQYIPDKVVVYSKQVANPTQTSPITEKPADITVKSTEDELNTQVVTGVKASEAVKQIGRASQRTYRFQNKYYTTSTYIKIPTAKAPDKPKNISKATSNVAEAASTKPIQHSLFCATDSCVQPPRSLGIYAGTIQGFYKTQANNKVYNLTSTSTVKGTHNAAWYTTCHTTICPFEVDPKCIDEPTNCTPSTPRIASKFVNTFINISDEKKYYKTSYDTNGNLIFTALTLPTNNMQFVAGFSAGYRGICGIAIINGPYGLTDLTSPGQYGSCGNDGENEDQTIVAHEIGHTFGLLHTTEFVDENGNPNGGIMAYDDMREHVFPADSYLYPSQQDYIRAPHPYFHANTGDVIPSSLAMTDVFARNSAGNVATRWNSSILGWSSWGNIPAGAAVQSSVAAASSGRGDLHLFARNSAGALIHSYYGNFGWSSWSNLAGGMQNYPAAVSWGPNRYDVFIRGTNNQLYQKYWNGTAWSTWSSFGGNLTAAPAVASWGTRRLDVFIRNQNNNLAVKSFNGTAWSTNFKAFSGTISTAPTAVSWGPNRIDVFALNGSNALVQKTYNNGTWTTWKNLGAIPNGAVGNAPAVTSPAVGQLHLFARSNNGTVLRATMTNGVLSSWQDLGGSIQSSPAAISWR